MTTAGRKYKTLGILHTGWTDSSQTLYRQSLPGLAFGAAVGWQSGMVDTNTFFSDYCAQMYPAAVAPEVGPGIEALSVIERVFEHALQNATQQAFWRDPLAPALLARLESHQAELPQARLLAESAEERLQLVMQFAPDDPTLNSLLLAARLFDYLGMKCLYVLKWAGYSRQLEENPDQRLVTLYIGIQINAQNHGMLADLLDTITGLREPYRRAWLEESTPYHPGAAKAR